MSGIKSTYSKQRDHTSSGHSHLPITIISGSMCLFPSQESVPLQSRQVKRTPQDSINELIIWKMNQLVVPAGSVKFKELLCISENFSVFGQIENLWMD